MMREYRRHLPHQIPESVPIFLTWNVKGAMPRMQALEQVVKENGVTHMAAICAICKAQFTKVVPYYKYPMDMIQSVHGLVSKAIRLTPADK